MPEIAYLPLDDGRPSGSRGRPSEHLAVVYDPPAREGAEQVSILYLHGFGSNQSGEKAAYFRTRAVRAGIGFCSYDARGHGMSGGSTLSMTQSENLADLARVERWLDERGATKRVLFGSSMGGGVALWAAALRPERASHVFALAPALRLERGLLNWAGPEGERRWREAGVIRYEQAGVVCDLSWNLVEDLKRYPLERLAELATAPTLIFQGMRDASVSWRDVAEFAERAHRTHPRGGIELHLFANGDHRLADRMERIGDLLIGRLHGGG